MQFCSLRCEQGLQGLAEQVLTFPVVCGGDRDPVLVRDRSGQGKPHTQGTQGLRCLAEGEPGSRSELFPVPCDSREQRARGSSKEACICLHLLKCVHRDFCSQSNTATGTASMPCSLLASLKGKNTSLFPFSN